MPSPFILKDLPLGVPWGTFKLTVFSSVGILIVAPRAASEKSKGTSNIK